MCGDDLMVGMPDEVDTVVASAHASNGSEAVEPSSQEDVMASSSDTDELKIEAEGEEGKPDSIDETVEPTTSQQQENGVKKNEEPETEDSKPEHSSTSTNGNAHEEQSNAEAVSRKESDDDVIMLDDDEEENLLAGDEPPAKKRKEELANGDSAPGTPAAKDSKDGTATSTVQQPKEPELTSSEALLVRLEEYVANAIDKNENVERKVLDALLGAINVQVQKEPLSVRKLILDKQLVLPNTISFPPSQVVDLLIEHDPEVPLSKVLTRMFGDERPRLTDNEKKERHIMKSNFPAPHMTKLLLDIGQDLVQEATYCDIVHARNLPETPKNIETYKQVAAQLKPVWENLRKKNDPYKLKLYSCLVCGFKTDSRIVLAEHRSKPHYDGRKYQCAMCPEFDTNESRIMNHYLESHAVVASKEETSLPHQCGICDEDFQYKGQRDQHMRVCRKDYTKTRHIMAPKNPDDHSILNRWLWDKPPVDQTILQQQQQAQAQQQNKARAAQQQQAAAALAMAQAQRRFGQSPVGLSAAALQQQQALIRQAQESARLRQTIMQRGVGAAAANAAATTAAAANAVRNNIVAAAATAAASNIATNSIIAAMQHQLQMMSRNGGAANQATLALYQRQLQAALSKGANPQLAAAAAAALQQQAQAAALKRQTPAPAPRPANATPAATAAAQAAATTHSANACEICDQNVADRERYLTHLQIFHKQMKGKTVADMSQGAPLACSRCRDRFWTYEGLERHLVMAHGLVTSDLLGKAQRKEDGGRCKLCGKQYAFNMLQHLVADHQVKLCSAEIMYSCDVCAFKCSSYQKLETHLNTMHPKSGDKKANGAQQPANGTSTASDQSVITLDD